MTNALNKISKISQKMASEIHFRAMKDGLLTSIPFLMVAGAMILLNYVILEPTGFLGKVVNPTTLTEMQGFGLKVLNGTMNIYSIILVVLITASLAKQRAIQNVGIAISVSLAAFFITMPSHPLFDLGDGKVAEIAGALSTTPFGQQGVFMAIICSMVSTELYAKFSLNSRFKVKLGDNVPEAVTESFNAIIAVMFTTLIFALVSFGIYSTSGYEIQELIQNLIQTPLKGLTTSPIGFFVLSGIGIFLFSLGIHPGGVIPFVEPVLNAATQENMEAFQQGLRGSDIPNIITTPFRDIYGHIGGTGQTLALVVAIFIFARYKSNKTFAKLTLPTSLFNINEPIIFGFPVVMNPIIMIPFLFVPLISFTIAYVATAMNLVSRVVLYIPWSTPPVINAWLASGGDWRNVVLQILIFVLSVCMYLPFLKLHEKEMATEVALEGAAAVSATATPVPEVAKETVITFAQTEEAKKHPVNILLSCNEGMSTSFLVKKMQEEAVKNELDVNIRAVAEPSLSIDLIESEKIDVVMLGPQIAFLEDKVKERLNNRVPIEPINREDFGKINGGAVLNRALTLIHDNQTADEDGEK